jgi:hypothetical protein
MGMAATDAEPAPSFGGGHDNTQDKETFYDPAAAHDDAYNTYLSDSFMAELWKDAEPADLAVTEQQPSFHNHNSQSHAAAHAGAAPNADSSAHADAAARVAPMELAAPYSAAAGPVATGQDMAVHDQPMFPLDPNFADVSMVAHPVYGVHPHAADAGRHAAQHSSAEAQAGHSYGSAPSEHAAAADHSAGDWAHRAPPGACLLSGAGLHGGLPASTAAPEHSGAAAADAAAQPLGPPGDALPQSAAAPAAAAD